MTKRGSGKVEKNWLEWVVFGVGLLLVVSTLAYLVYDGATSADGPPDIEVRLGEPRPGGSCSPHPSRSIRPRGPYSWRGRASAPRSLSAALRT